MVKGSCEDQKELCENGEISAGNDMIKDRLKWIISGLDFEDLTDWEQRFVESVEGQFQRKGDLTEKQEELLEKIYREKGR